jgi:hypothetical protein
MVQLNMSPIAVGARLTLGPAPWFRLERHELREGPTERLVGELRNRQWRVEGQDFTEVMATPGSTLRFESDGPVSRQYGPFQSLHISDGKALGDGKLVARFDDDTYMWRCAATQQAWPSIVVASP